MFNAVSTSLSSLLSAWKLTGPISPATGWWIAGGLVVILTTFIWLRHRSGSTDNSGGWKPERLAFDALAVFVAFDNLPRLVFDRQWPPALLAVLVISRLVWSYAFQLVRPPKGFLWASGCRLGALAGFLGGAVWLAAQISPSMPAASLLFDCGTYLTLTVLASMWHLYIAPRIRPEIGEELRYALLLIFALLLTHPFFSPRLVGNGDAILYWQTVRDFLNQLYSGIWPPWVSQSEVAPFGAVFPFRLATYHYYFAALIDGITGRQLNVYSVQHLTVVFSFVGGAWAMYAVLRRFCPSEPWIACGMSALYIASPAWLGPLYSLSMFFTTMVLPFAPLAIAGIRPDIGARTVAHAILHGAVLALVWHAHPPVGGWVCFVVGSGQLLGWLILRPTLATIARQGLSWLVCAALCSGLWYSINTLRGGSMNSGLTSLSTTLAILRDAFPASILPAANSPGGLSDIQLGYSLSLALLAGLALSVWTRRELFIWVLPASLLMTLLVPVPWLTQKLWGIVPIPLTLMAGNWPVQRLMAPLVASATIIGTLCLAYFAARSHRWRRFLIGLMVTMLAWTIAEAFKYVRRGHVTALPAALSTHLSKPENSPLILNWLAFHNHPLPSVYQSHIDRNLDARLFNSIWSRDRSRLLADNYAAVLSSKPDHPPITVSAVPLAQGQWHLLPGFEFAPRKNYLLQLSPTSGTVPGTFLMVSPNLQRQEATLTANGPTVAFPFWVSDTGPRQTTELYYLPTNPAQATEPVSAFLNYRVFPYEAADLPVVIESYAPYRATLNASEAGWLETHRMYTEGYRATVNDQPAEVSKSADFRVMISVPTGASRVRLDYVGTPGLRASFNFMVASWLVTGLWGFWMLGRSWRSAARLGS